MTEAVGRGRADRRLGVASLATALLLAASVARADQQAAPDDKDAALLARYFQSYMLARFCLNAGVEFEAAEVDRVQETLNAVADALPLPEERKSQIWYALQGNLTSVGGEISADDCAGVRKTLVALMPKAIAAERPGGGARP